MHPVAFSAAFQGEDRHRMSVFFRIFVVIPWLVVGFFYAIGALFATIGAWFSIVFTGTYPPGLYAFNAGFVRYATRVNGFYNLLTDEHPSFGRDEDPEYPVRTLVGPAKSEYNRMKALFRIFWAIPVAILGYVHGLILQACGVIAWLIIVFTGELPVGLYRPMRISSAYMAKSLAFHLLLTEDFPPFWQDEEEEAPRFERAGPGITAEPTTALGL